MSEVVSGFDGSRQCASIDRPIDRAGWTQTPMREAEGRGGRARWRTDGRYDPTKVLSSGSSVRLTASRL